MDTTAKSKEYNKETEGYVQESAVLSLDRRGTIRDCDGAGERLFGFSRGELISKHVSRLLPQLADVELLQNGHVNSRLRFLCRIGVRFRAVCRDGASFLGGLSLIEQADQGAPYLRMIVRRCDVREGVLA